MPEGRLKVATKYPAITKDYFLKLGRQVEIIKLYGSMELAPIVGLADLIVDLVETGNTLKANGLTMNDIDLVELNEAFASQCLYCRDTLEVDPSIYNVNGGSIAIGHPFGMTGSRLTGHIVRELKRREKKYGIVSMCIGGGMGAAGLFESC